MSVNMTPSAHCDFFSRFTAPLFAFYRETRGATPVWYATPYIYVYPSPLRQVVAIEIYATKGVRERKRRDKEKFSKILQEDVSRERGYSSSEEESPI